jgi:hypothetical protein
MIVDLDPVDIDEIKRQSASPLPSALDLRCRVNGWDGMYPYTLCLHPALGAKALSSAGKSQPTAL